MTSISFYHRPKDTKHLPSILPCLSLHHGGHCRFALVLVAFTAALSLSATAQSDPAEVLAKATQQSTLTEIERSWHAKLALTVFDEKGANPIEGTFEYWQSGNDSLRSIRFGDATETVLRNDNKFYKQDTSSFLLETADEIADAFLHPGPRANDPGMSNLSQRKQSFGKATLTCFMLGPGVLTMEQTPLGLFPTYCVEPDNGHLRLTFSLGSKGVTVQQIGNFLDHTVPIQFTIGENGIIVGKAKVLEMATFTPTPEFFAPRPELPSAGTGTARIASGVVSGLKLGGDIPVYPASAKEKHLQGTVTMHAIIGRDGRVRSLRIITAPSGDLGIAALAAVRTWRYRPYLLNGSPTSVDTTIIINFNLNG